MTGHQFEKGTTSRVRNQRVNEDTGNTGNEVAYKDVVKGAEVGDGGYVMLTQEELESVEPGRSRTIDIADFVEAAEIDPNHYQRSYYLAPSDEELGVPEDKGLRPSQDGMTCTPAHPRSGGPALTRVEHPA